MLILKQIRTNQKHPVLYFSNLTGCALVHFKEFLLRQVGRATTCEEKPGSKVGKPPFHQQQIAILWDIMGYYGISWDIIWDIMGYHGILWDIMGYHGISWGIIWDIMGYNMGYHGDSNLQNGDER